MRKFVEGEGGKPIEVSTIEDSAERYSMDKPEPHEMEVEPETVSVKVGCLEIRQQEGRVTPWMVEVLLDGEPVKKVRSIDLHIEVHRLPTVTITHYV